MAGLGNIELVVTPEVLAAKAVTAAEKVRTMKQAFDNINTHVNRMSAYWTGDSSEVYQKRYTDRQDDIDEIFRRLNENIEDLTNIAGVYEQVDRQLTQAAQVLPEDVIG